MDAMAKINIPASVGNQTQVVHPEDSLDRTVSYPHSLRSSVGYICRSKLKSSYTSPRAERVLSMTGQTVSVICQLKVSQLVIGKVKWLENRTNSDMKVVPVSGESFSISHEASLVYHSI
jgi:hypothetical protein